MTHQLQPITITPEQITAAAQLIVNKDENAWAHTEGEYLAAVEGYLRACVSDLLADADWHANRDNFRVGTKYTPMICDEADELVMPPAPEWAHDAIATATTEPVAVVPLETAVLEL